MKGFTAVLESIPLVITLQRLVEIIYALGQRVILDVGTSGIHNPQGGIAKPHSMFGCFCRSKVMHNETWFGKHELLKLKKVQYLMTVRDQRRTMSTIKQLTRNLADRTSRLT